jgi:RNA polymerase sigma factor (sigma-70 family)
MNDAELIAQVCNDNTSACRFLVDKYKNLVWHMVLRMVNQQEDAEDLCQEVFLRVFRDIRKFRGDSKLSTWIGTITYHVCVDYIRRKGREKVDFTDTMEKVAFGKVSDEDATELFDRASVKKLVHQLIGEMPLHYRTVITLYHLEEFSYKEISEVTGMPEGTVKSYINRGRNMIRERILQSVPDIHPVSYHAD